MNEPLSLDRTDDVARDHDRQSAAHDDIRARVDHKIGEEIDRETNSSGQEERAQVESIAHELKAKSVHELRRSERELEKARRVKRVYQFIDYLFGVVYGLIGLMIGLALFGARNGSGFMRFMHAVTNPLLAPFHNVMPNPGVGSFRLMLSYVLALIVYALLHLAVKRAFRILIRRDVTDL